MNSQLSGFLKNYNSILKLLLGIVAGTVLGLILGNKVEVLKPIGDIFLNLLFTAVIPLIFFAISSSVANMDRDKKMGKIMFLTLLVFIGTVFISYVNKRLFLPGILLGQLFKQFYQKMELIIKLPDKKCGFPMPDFVRYL